MPNVNPVAVLQVDFTELQFPQNKVKASLAGSYDYDKNGNISQRKSMQYVFDAPGGEIEMINNTDALITFEAPGEYLVKGSVFDNRGLSGVQEVLIKIKPEIILQDFGIKLQDVTKEEELKLLNDLGCTVFRPNGVALETYTDSDNFNFEYFYNNGIKLIVSIGWQNSQSGVIRKFPTDLVAAEAKLRSFLSKWGRFIYIAACENEPTNDSYFGSQPVADYIAWLRVFVTVCKEYGVMSTDGSTHLEYFEILRNNGNKPTGRPNQVANMQQVLDLHAAYKTMPDLTFVNFHTGIKGSFADGFFTNNIKYLADATGKSVIGGEIGFKDVAPQTVKNAVAEIKKSKISTFVVWSGDGGTGNSEADAFTLGTELTDLGRAYGEAIK
jgi:hypothetical protein